MIAAVTLILNLGSQSLTPNEVEKRMEAAYRHVASFEDRIVVFDNMSRHRRIAATATIYFKSPPVFRFEYRNPFEGQIARISRDKRGRIRTQMIPEPEPLLEGYQIPSLLDMEWPFTEAHLLLGDRPAGDENWQHVGEDEVAGRKCYRLSSREENGSISILWVDEKTYLVRKRRERDDSEFKDLVTCHHPNLGRRRS